MKSSWRLRGRRRIALSDRLASQSGNQVDAATEIMTRTYALNPGCGTHWSAPPATQGSWKLYVSMRFRWLGDVSRGGIVQGPNRHEFLWLDQIGPNSCTRGARLFLAGKQTMILFAMEESCEPREQIQRTLPSHSLQSSRSTASCPSTCSTTGPLFFREVFPCFLMSRGRPLTLPSRSFFFLTPRSSPYSLRQSRLRNRWPKWSPGSCRPGRPRYVPLSSYDDLLYCFRRLRRRRPGSVRFFLLFIYLNALRAYPATVPTTQYPDCSMCPDVFVL